MFFMGTLLAHIYRKRSNGQMAKYGQNGHLWKERSKSKNKNSSEISEQVRTNWQHAQLKMSNLPILVLPFPTLTLSILHTCLDYQWQWSHCRLGACGTDNWHWATGAHAGTSFNFFCRRTCRYNLLNRCYITCHDAVWKPCKLTEIMCAQHRNVFNE